jgi:signal transduction histidine kinase
MKIRDKLFIAFTVYVLLASILGFAAFRELRTISKRLSLVETADDLMNTILEVRRHEKNFIIYRGADSLAELKVYISLLRDRIDSIKAEIAREIEPENFRTMMQEIADYERGIDVLSDNFKSQQGLAVMIRAAGKAGESAVTGTALQDFLTARRLEKNIMLYKDREAYAAFNKVLDSPKLSTHKEIRDYRALVTELARLVDQEKTVTEGLRHGARTVESFIQSLTQKERSDIAATIRFSIYLLVIALVLIVVVGTVVNAKLAHSIVTPIRNLERITNKIARGDFSEGITVKGHDEIAALAASFNQMEEKLEHAMTSLEEIIKKLQEKQAQLVEAEKLASIGKLAAGIAHEINNPLTSVLTFSNLMLEQCKPEDPWCAKLKLMTRETDRARNIVRQLLNFGREIVIRPEKININRPVEEIADSLEAQEAFKGIELSRELAEDLPEISADPAQIGQVVLNLLLNAVHAITPPGRIGVATRLRDRAVEIVISDTGRGIPEEHLHKIFDPFFTTKDASKGTGLGLAVSYGIVKKHGGEIDVASAVGKGTTFTVRLPVNPGDTL